MKWACFVYRQYVRISISSAVSYRTNFFFTAIITLLSNLLIPLLTVLIYAGGAELPGWTFHEALLVQSVFMLCTGLCGPFFFNMVWITMEHVREGTYDLLMLKPGSTLFITVASSFEIENIGVLVGGVVMFVYCLLQLPFPGFFGWAEFLLLFLMGICMTLGCILLMSATAFKWVGNTRIYEIFDAMTMFGRYPGTVYGSVLRGVTNYMIPVAMMGFLPASALLGRTTREMFFAFIPCIGFLALGWAVFKRMTFHYQSAGG